MNNNAGSDSVECGARLVKEECTIIDGGCVQGWLETGVVLCKSEVMDNGEDVAAFAVVVDAGSDDIDRRA